MDKTAHRKDRERYLVSVSVGLSQEKTDWRDSRSHCEWKTTKRRNKNLRAKKPHIESSKKHPVCKS